MTVFEPRCLCRLKKIFATVKFCILYCILKNTKYMYVILYFKYICKKYFRFWNTFYICI